MTNTPGGGADLGSAYATIGWHLDDSGFQKYIQQVAQLGQIQQKVATGQQQQLIAPSQGATAQVAAATRAQAQIASAQIAATSRVEAARVASAGRVAAAEQQALTRTQPALLAANARVEAARLASVAKVETAEIRAATQAANAARRAQTSQTALPRTFAGFTGQGALQAAGALGIATGVGQLTQQLVALGRESADLAIKAETIGTAYEASTKRAGVSADALLKSLQAAARGTVTTADLQASANKALALGVGQNAEQIGQLLAIARQKGKDFGESTAQAFEDITVGLGRLSPRILDNLGIILDETKIYKDYAKAIGTTADKLSDQEKRQALVNDLIKNNTDLIQKNASAQLDAADKLAKAQSQRDEALTRAGPGIAAIETRALNVLTNIFEAANPEAGKTDAEAIQEQLLATSKSYADYVDAIKKKRAELNGVDGSLTGDVLNMLAGGHDANVASFLEATTAAEFAANKQAEALRALNEAGELKGFGIGVRNAQNLAQALGTLPAGANAAANLGGLHDPMEDARRADARRAENEGIKARQANEQQLITDTIAGSEQLLQKRKAVSIELGNLETQYTDRVAEGQKQIVKTYADAATEIGQVVAKGAEDRKKIESDNADQISRLIRDHTQQDARTIEDQSRADARDAQDFVNRRALDNKHFAEQEAASQAAFNESRALDNKHFAEQQAASDVAFARQREQLVASQHDAQVRRDEDFARQEQRAREVAQAEELKSTENFVTRLFEATRGRGGAGKRAEANKQLAQARAEAAELAKTDAAAAAAYLAERQRQILEGLDVAASNRQLRKDAKRGGALGRSEAEAEIEAEQQARDDANKAALDLIRQQAKERADDRAKQTGDQATADKTALDDLDKQHAEQKQKAIDAHKEQQDEQDAAFAEQKQHAEAAHKEQQQEEDAARAEAIKRRDADRALEKKRRDADYAQQLQDLKDSNAKRLKEFDTAQKDRIDQINDQAGKQADATKAGLDKVDKEYQKARAKVLIDYAKFIGELEGSLSKEADNLDMLPGPERQKQLADAYHTFGETVGQSFADGIMQRLAGALPGALIGPPNPGAGTIGSGRRAQRVPGGIIFDDNTTNDPRPNQAGINSVVAGGVVGDTFDARRPNSTIVHQGIDIRVQDGTPVHAPYDLTDLHIGYYADADRKGWYVTGIDPFGREWYIGHLAKPNVKEGGSIKKGGVVGVVAAGLGHVHVQIKPRRGNDVTPIDPSAALDAAGAAPAPTPDPRRAGGAQAQRLTGGQRIAVPPGTPDWAIPGSDVWGPTMGLPSRAAVAQTVDASVTIDLSYSTFGPGLTRDEVEGWFRPVVDAALRDNHADGRRDLLRRIDHFDAQGALRS